MKISITVFLLLYLSRVLKVRYCFVEVHYVVWQEPQQSRHDVIIRFCKCRHLISTQTHYFLLLYRLGMDQ